MPLDPALKQLQIKVGAAKRTKKEYEAYVKEEGTQRSKIDAMRTTGEEEADIKKQMEVLNDTLTVLPDARHRLQKYATELRDFLAESHQEVPVVEGEDPEVQIILEARQLLREVDQTLGTQTAEEEPAEDVAGTGGTADVGDF
ncbi:Tbca [Symbiodinium pilosum]|uniref:Tubulin-specific chaperone A n=1 Tax=Symbiodinium pilosum TaxID=2952 RepID=A0A812IWI6_SYMPI|nr:Tbca [Symbiodinium pilosum]